MSANWGGGSLGAVYERGAVMGDETVPTGAKVPAPKVTRKDLHPKVKAGGLVYVGVMLAGVIAALTQMQSTVKLSPMAAVGVTGALAILPLLAAFFKAGDGR